MIAFDNEILPRGKWGKLWTRGTNEHGFSCQANYKIDLKNYQTRILRLPYTY
jgi:hypothetical protein